MARKTKKADRIQKAINGHIIEFSAIPRVYAHAEKLVAEGYDDDQLRDEMNKYLGARP